MNSLQPKYEVLEFKNDLNESLLDWIEHSQMAQNWILISFNAFKMLSMQIELDWWKEF